MSQKIRSHTLDHPVAKSIVGRLTLCASAEALLGIAGAFFGELILTPILQQTGRYAFPVIVSSSSIFFATATLYAVKTKTSRTAQLILASVTGAALIYPYSWEQLSQWGEFYGSLLGGLIGKNLGTILGGYVGLMITDCTVPFWNGSCLSETYLIGMGKYLLMGIVLDNMVEKSTLPVMAPLINIPRGTICLIAKSAAYNSNMVIQKLKDRNLTREMGIPLFIKMLCGRFCDQHAITDKLINMVTPTLHLMPQISNVFRLFIKHPKLYNRVSDQVKIVIDNSDQLTIIFMRSLYEYVQLFKEEPLKTYYKEYLKNKSNLKIFKTSLKQKIEGASTYSPVYEKIMGSTTKIGVIRLIESIQQMEKDLIGYQVTQNSNDLQELSSIHLKYFLLHTLLKLNNKDLLPCEQKTFFFDLNEILLTRYTPHPVGWTVYKISFVALNIIFGFKTWIAPFFEQPEQQTTTISQIQVFQDYEPLSPPLKIKKSKEGQAEESPYEGNQIVINNKYFPPSPHLQSKDTPPNGILSNGSTTAILKNDWKKTIFKRRSISS